MANVRTTAPVIRMEIVTEVPLNNAPPVYKAYDPATREPVMLTEKMSSAEMTASIPETQARIYEKIFIRNRYGAETFVYIPQGFYRELAAEVFDGVINENVAYESEKIRNQFQKEKQRLDNRYYNALGELKRKHELLKNSIKLVIFVLLVPWIISFVKFVFDMISL